MKFLSLVNISSGANTNPSPIAIPQTASDQLLFMIMAENKDPMRITTPKLVVINDLYMLTIGLLFSRDFRAIFFLGCCSLWETDSL